MSIADKAYICDRMLLS